MSSLDEDWGWFVDIETYNTKEPLYFHRQVFMDSIDEEYEYHLSTRKMRSVSPPLPVMRLNPTRVKLSWFSTLLTYLLHVIKWF